MHTSGLDPLFALGPEQFLPFVVVHLRPAHRLGPESFFHAQHGKGLDAQVTPDFQLTRQAPVIRSLRQSPGLMLRARGNVPVRLDDAHGASATQPDPPAIEQPGPTAPEQVHVALDACLAEVFALGYIQVTLQSFDPELGHDAAQRVACFRIMVSRASLSTSAKPCASSTAPRYAWCSRHRGPCRLAPRREAEGLGRPRRRGRTGLALLLSRARPAPAPCGGAGGLPGLATWRPGGVAGRSGALFGAQQEGFIKEPRRFPPVTLPRGPVRDRSNQIAPPACDFCRTQHTKRHHLSTIN